MIAEVPGGYNQRRTSDLYALRDKSRRNPPKCYRCGQKLAFDRAGETLPTCNNCAKDGHAHINASGGQEKNSGAHKGPQTVPVPRLFTVRTSLGISRAKLAKLSGSHDKTIRRIEDGPYQRTQPRTAQKYADALGVRLEDLQ